MMTLLLATLGWCLASVAAAAFWAALMAGARNGALRNMPALSVDTPSVDAALPAGRGAAALVPAARTSGDQVVAA